MGQVEVLKPLVHSHALEKREAVISGPIRRRSPLQPSLFRRTQAAAGSFALIGLILLSGILVAIYEPIDDPMFGSASSNGIPIDLAMDHDVSLTPVEGPLAFDSFSPRRTLESDHFRAVRSIARPRRAKRRVRLAAHRPAPRIRGPLISVTEFVPTTLVIYAENGEIKRRIEPQLTAVYKKPLS